MHCRSYPSSYAAMYAAKIFKKLEFIFDPRSDFPEENVTAGNWTESGSEYKFWRAAEHEMLIRAAGVACISQMQFDIYKNNCPDVQGFMVPNNVECERFKRSDAVRNAIRDNLNIKEDEIVLCYLGDLTSGGWHRVGLYLEVCKFYQANDCPIKLLFIVPEVGARLLEEALDTAGYMKQVIIKSVPYDEVPSYLAAADYGLMYMHRSRNGVGTKIGEYLAAGLPVIVNQNCLGAVDLISQNNIGHVINIGVGDLDVDANLSSVDQIKSGKCLTKMSEEVSDFALRYFDNKLIAERYYQRYKLLNK